MTRWLITGCKGQLGSDLQRLLAGQDVTAVDLPEVDITDPAAVTALTAEWAAGDTGPDLVIVNAAAWTNVDGAEEHEAEALRVNGEAPGLLATATDELGARLVHISTDYVFDGRANSPYAEDATPDPQSAYGRTKLAGERAVLGSGAHAWVLRTAWVYGETGRNFVKTMARAEQQRDTLTVVDDQRGSPTWSRDLAAAVIEVVTKQAPPGIYHVTGSGDTTWCGFARAIFEELGTDPQRVQGIRTEDYPTPTQRPAYSVLGAHKWAAAGLTPMPHWRDALREAFATAGPAFRAG